MPKVTTKKKCCKDRPRCRTCPVVLKRLSDLGLAERDGRRSFRIEGSIPKKTMRLARAWA